MFHLAAFTSAKNAIATTTATPGVQDGWLTLSAGSNYIIPRRLRLAFALAQGLTMSLAQIATPSLRPISPPSIQPVLQSATIPSVARIANFGPNGPQLLQNEELTALTNSGAAAERQHVFAGLHDGNMNWETGASVITVHGTMANTGAADVWTGAGITFDQTLESGNYRVVGMDVVGALLFAARIRFATGGMLPGCIGRPSFAVQPNMLFRGGALGSWGEFIQTAPPTIECMFSGGAGTTQDIFLDLIKIG